MCNTKSIGTVTACKEASCKGIHGSCPSRWICMFLCTDDNVQHSESIFLFFFVLNRANIKNRVIIIKSSNGFVRGHIWTAAVWVWLLIEVCWLVLGARSTLQLLQQHVKDPSHSAKSAGGRLQLNTHTPLTHWGWSGLSMPLSRQSVEICQEMSSHATHQGTLGYSRLSLLSHCGLILA